MTALSVRLDQTAVKGGTMRVITLEGPALGLRRIHHHLPGQQPPEPALLDGALFSVLMLASRSGAALKLRGPVSALALRQAHELLEAWACMAPSEFQVTGVEPDAVVEADLRTGAPAAVAYAGDVHSAFTLVRHASGALGATGYRIGGAVLVEGHEVGLGDQSSFDRLRRGAARWLEPLELEALVVRTDARALDQWQPWPMSRSALMAGVLHGFSDRFDHGLVSGPAGYLDFGRPSGSSPATDGLLSGAALRIVHDGAGYDHRQKAALLAAFAGTAA